MATNPEKLLAIEKEREIKLKSLIPQLINLRKPFEEIPLVEVYEGKEGIKSIYEEASKRNLNVNIQSQKNNNSKTYFLRSINGRVGDNTLTNDLRKLKVFNNKHIPHKYKTSSRKDRLKLLAGIIDTDGYSAHGGIGISMVNKNLVDDIIFLSRSLGFATYCKEYIAHIKSIGYSVTAYKISISGDCSIIPIRLHHKIQKKRTQIKDVLTTGFTVEKIGLGEYYGFELDTIYGNQEHEGEFHKTGFTLQLIQNLIIQAKLHIDTAECIIDHAVQSIKITGWKE